MPRAVKWFTTLGNRQALASGSQNDFNLLAAVSQANMKGSTVTRMIVDMWVDADTASSHKIMDFGILWLDGDAVAANVLPDTDVETERADYILRSRMVLSAHNVNTEVREGAFRHYDIRAQRICRADTDQLTLVVDLDSGTTGGLFLDFMIRVLIRLP